MLSPEHQYKKVKHHAYVVLCFLGVYSLLVRNGLSYARNALPNGAAVSSIFIIGYPHDFTRRGKSEPCP